MDLQSPRPVSTVRRNPPRRAKQGSSTHALSSSNPSNAITNITPFPLDEIFDPEASQIYQPQKSINLKVFLRIRPLENFAGGVARAVGRVRFAKEEERKNVACLFVNSSSSVTLNGPSTALQSRRAKNEVYDGFSHVFAPESVQEDIYAKVMRPLVMDFMEGHSSLLVAMGPTGSGKTYTMFGSQQQAGIVPLALRQIFSQTADNENIAASRTYYLSMFEIHSERGKGEKIFDLFPEPTPHQQASFGGFNEVRISSVADAEKLVAHGIFKRSTAPTHANNQSSRSQCIINVRCNLKSDKDDHSFTNAVLTIADLAGAERERKTGNQGTRLLESNFINNTSMVFGQCLRSLLEHQKNPKKPIEKHFKNSLLTRYLQDYMEGKKQMTLILTVKAGQEDYMDTSFILRQASPYMKIKFYHLQENNNAPCLKRENTSFITERRKRRKVNASKVSLIDGVHVVMDAAGASKISEKDSVGEQICSQDNQELHVELQKIKRSEEVMTNFARALLSTLKQYKDKLKESENQVRYLKESLRKQSTDAKEIEKELNEIRHLRSCPTEQCANVLSVNHDVSVPPILAVPDHVEVDIAVEAYSSLPLEENAEELRDQFLHHKPENYQKHTQNYVQMEKMDNLVKNLSDAVSLEGPRDNAPVNILLDGSECNGKTSNHLRCFPQPTVPPEDEGCIFHLPGSEEISVMQEEKEQSEEKITLTENVQQCATSLSTEALKNEGDIALRPLNYERPKRKLLPASAIHFNDFNGLFMDENAMEIKRKKTANVKARSDGSISLIRIFQSNLPR